ncbi:hypothetical protein V2G26_009451 [Clonostachys chloroleuca]
MRLNVPFLWAVTISAVFAGELFQGFPLFIDKFKSSDLGSEYGRIRTIPAIRFQADGQSCFAAQDLEHIVIDKTFACAKDKNGHTLIPPTLTEFAQTFQEDVGALVGIQPQISQGTEMQKKSVFLTLNKNGTHFLDAAGRPTSEGYTIDATDSRLVITGASPLGAVFQLGEAVMPRDGANVASCLTWAGIITPRVSQGNVLISVSEEEMWRLYSGFRLSTTSSFVNGLASPANESYTRSQFEDIQHTCAQRGVTIIPEINSPAHALAITKWKPKIALRGDPSMLNISHPDTLATMKGIWQTFLPWFHCKTVHIGADEYSDQLVADYSKYVDELATFISHAGKQARIWGTFPPREGGNYTKAIDVQHWAPYEDNPYFDFIQNGYQVVNSDFAFYINTKWHGYFPQTLNKTLIFNGNPQGGPYRPFIFDTRNATNNALFDEAGILGHIAAQWSDYGPSASTYLEAYYSWRDSLPALADKTWGGDISEQEYDAIIEMLIRSAPGQNLDRRVKSENDVIFDYQFSLSQPGAKTIADRSANRYNATNYGCINHYEAVRFSNACFLETPLTSKGRNYSLSFWIKPDVSSDQAILFSGSDSALYSGYGSSSNITIVSGNQPYSLNYSLPIGKWTHVVLSGRDKRTFLSVTESDSTQRTMEFLAKVEPKGVPGSNGVMFVWMPIAVEAPLKRIGHGFSGLMKNITLVDDHWGAWP